MPRKVIIVADPGIDTAFAVALALNDPNIEVVGLLPTAGNVSAEQATANVHTLIDVMDPPKWPKLAAALPARYDRDGLALHGPGGLGGVNFPSATRHTLHPADKILCELAHESPRQVTVINLGPLTTLATALDRDPTLPAPRPLRSRRRASPKSATFTPLPTRRMFCGLMSRCTIPAAWATRSASAAWRAIDTMRGRSGLGPIIERRVCPSIHSRTRYG
jgi:hypothetical protein